MSQTLDQQRAAFAWECATRSSRLQEKQRKQYKVLAKGAPALIMNSGLMPTLAFYNQKDDVARLLLDDLIRGLKKRIEKQETEIGQGQRSFATFMSGLQAKQSPDYLRYSDEALELLKWIRQFVDAVGDREPAR